ncbi:helix-turn-helix domain-containing protein [Luteimonas aestuarii]|uniref:citrate synthase (unknown stereospecificity) n=1 Tax=Luteimonas aestuarii TaxID=453837 RepID=A0A4R5TVI8_9GAMM|nr:citrate synthase family protein [Luteimonas aestuarii]TDK25104.1 helix-turn-helix domain-containing protein [Luteimonas aestuarii]
MQDEFIPANDACERLGVSPATLYAYVSRGLVQSRPGADHRSRVYRRTDIDKLVQRKRAGRGAARGAAQSLDRGLPVMETRISLIRPDGPWYRGRSATALVREGATLEDTARLLWDCGGDDPFASAVSDEWPGTVRAVAGNTQLPPLERAMASIPLLALDVRHSFNASPAVRRDVAATLLRQNAALLVGATPSDAPVHQVLARRWRPGDAGFADLVRAALVVCADHELNVSAFAARVVASTGAHLHATACTGLAALSGPRHGGATARAHALIVDALDAPSPAQHIAERWRRGDDLPGFGHALYPDGDPRATELLAMLRATQNAAAMRGLEEMIEGAFDASGQRPNIDLMLAALCFVHGLPGSHALVMFAAGRLAGWLAHALEQQELGRLIRPRARYIGTPPETPSDPEAGDAATSAIG